MQFGVSESIAHWGIYRPRATAISADGQVTSYSDLNSRINAICTQIDKNLDASPRIAVAANSKQDLLLALAAIVRTQNSVVLLNPTISEEGLRSNIEDTGVTGIVYDPLNDKLSNFFPSRGRLPIDFENIRLAKTGVQYDSRTESSATDEWGVLFSSGTSGTPKPIERNHESMVTELLGWCLELELRKSSCFYVGRPLSYTGGLVLTLATLLVGGQVVLDDVSEDEKSRTAWSKYQTAAAQCSLSWAFFVPEQIRDFLNIARASTADLHAAGSLLTMGSPISGVEKVQASRILGSRIVESWGNTESLGTITDASDLEERPDSIGRPFLTDRLLIVDDEGNPLPPNTTGRIAGNEEAGFEKYSNREDETRRVKRKNLIISDDIGYVDDAGYFYICGRIQESVILDNKTVFLPDLEEAIRQLPSIAACCVLALDAQPLEIGACVVLTEDNPADQELRARIRQTLATRFDISQLKYVSTLPQQSSSGKIDRLACKAIFESDG